MICVTLPLPRFGAPAPKRFRSHVSACTLVAATALAVLESGCAGHEDRVRGALTALDHGDPYGAVAALNHELEVKTLDETPSLKGDNALLLLDRATVLQSLDDFKLSARDFGVADKHVDLLDMSRTGADDLGKYLFSDSSGPYRAPAYEKLLLNSFNMLNYLALHDLANAKVEARRLSVMQKYIRDQHEESNLVGIGSYLAGLAFEKAGDTDEALAYYEDALRYAPYGSLREPLRVLTKNRPRSPHVRALIGDAPPLPSPAESGDAEIIVVVGFGRTPQKQPVRLPIGLALTMVAGAMSPGNAAQANALAAKGLVTWVNYPVLRPGRGGWSLPSFYLDGRGQGLDLAIDVEAEVVEAWHKKEETLVLAAITRMIARLVAGEVVEGIGKAGGNGAIGLLAGLATTATMSAFDTPDTRSWSTLPARVAIARLRVPAGPHEIQIGARGEAKRSQVQLAPGDWAVVPIMVLH